MDRCEEEKSTILTLQETNQTITVKDDNHYGLHSITDEGVMTSIPYKLRNLEEVPLKQDKTTHEPYFVNETIGNNVKMDRFINPIMVDILEATDALFAGPDCKIINTVNVRDRATRQIQDVRSDLTTLQTHKYTTADGEYNTEQIKKLVYDVSPTSGSEIVWMPPATQDTTKPTLDFGGREPRQKPATWTPPSAAGNLKMVITNNATGQKHDRTNCRRTNGRGHTTMSLEIDDKAKTINLTNTRLTDNRHNNREHFSLFILIVLLFLAYSLTYFILLIIHYY